LRCREPDFFFPLLRGFDLGGLFLDQLDEVVDDVGVFEAVVGEAAEVDSVGAVAAAGEADVGLARLARAVDDAADNGRGERRRDTCARRSSSRSTVLMTRIAGGRMTGRR
jgi:hypothetical protein